MPDTTHRNRLLAAAIALVEQLPGRLSKQPGSENWKIFRPAVSERNRRKGLFSMGRDDGDDPQSLRVSFSFEAPGFHANGEVKPEFSEQVVSDLKNSGFSYIDNRDNFRQFKVRSVYKLASFIARYEELLGYDFGLKAKLEELLPDFLTDEDFHDEDDSPEIIASDIDEDSEDVRRENVSRRIRDTLMARQVKRMHNWQCQLCGETIQLPDGNRYAEAHHIKPLGSQHNGPDSRLNLMVVCPHHHTLLDFGLIPLDLQQLRNAFGHRIDPEFIEYHNTTVCGRWTQ